MQLHPLKPRKALNKAYLKVKPNRSDIERFKSNLTSLLDQSNSTESEEFHKNLVIDFLKKTYYDPNYSINTKGRTDLVIHNGKDAKSNVGVVIETKKPTNKAEMLRKDQINVKAFHELLLYFLRERISQKNLEIKFMVATNIYEWFIFDAGIFEKYFAQNKDLVKQFREFEAGHLSGQTTDFFYREIAAPFLEEIKGMMEFTYFDLRDYEQPLRNDKKEDDNQLIALFKLLSPEHLLKLPFVNDSNSLDKRFYSELLHIIGLTETKQGGKKIIERHREGERLGGSLLENAILQLDTRDKIQRLPNPAQYGSSKEERLFNVGLELTITWINRILFLKLTEAQLIAYHKGDRSYAFLNFGKIHNFDDLDMLFFQVLAKKQTNRIDEAQKEFAHVPYLNSSLFDPSELEQETIFISNLRDEKTLPLHTQTVLKDENGKKRSGEMNSLQYLFAFLDAYDFSGDGGEEIQEDNKTLINASVLGLIFEKINGYKDGSFFTPGFITMYMCRETIRRAVVQKFNEVKGWQCESLDELYDKIDDREEANRIVNSLKICDPAVGSGHFLVSALNEIIAIKNDLRILQDRQGRRLKEYRFEVVNDELVVTDEDGELFEYIPTNAESQRVQEALFHEKQTIIENCLFGVDINPNSVKICRLRLWIELLKNAYYKNTTELETLPNIDINIKCGNSLVSRFDLQADMKQALKKSKWNVETYRAAVDSYRNSQSKEEKHEMLRLIDHIKSDFRSEISRNDPKMKKLSRLNGELVNLTTQTSLFQMTAKEKKAWNQKVEKLTRDTQKLEAEIEEIKNNKMYENAFEWRFAFPEVLNNAGDFMGFDVVIGNPPYIRQEEFSALKPYLQSQYETFSGTADLYVYFVEKGLNIAHQGGRFVYILPNKWMRAGYGLNLRKWIRQFSMESIIDFGDLPVFEEATTYPCIWFIHKDTPATPQFKSARVDTLTFDNGMDHYLSDRFYEVNQTLLPDTGWTLVDDKVQRLLEKIKKAGTPLAEYVEGKIFYGIKTGLNEAFVIDEDTKERLIREDPNSIEIIKPFLAGRDIKRYQQPRSGKFLIFTRRGIKIDKYSAVLNYLTQFREKLEPKQKNHVGSWQGRKSGTYKWYEIQDAVDYYEEFEKPKIIIPAIVKSASYTLDTVGNYSNDKTTIIPLADLFLLGLMNSSLIDFFLKNIASTKQNDYYEYKPVYISQLPIVNESNTEIEEKVSQILAIKKSNPQSDTRSLEAEIDWLVYKLYGLTYEEVEIVDPEFAMSEEDYELILKN